ncbi:RRP15-like protein [Culicoides brevitarsis]|uniref:RRP15-like protein n=1 Tax=Culicoides brevitarsis TaxID=469753 RepID=UPI00307B8E10
MSGSSSSESESDIGSDVHMSDDEYPVSDDNESIPDDDNYLEDDQKESSWANALKKVLKSAKDSHDGRSKVLSKAKKMTEIERIKVERKGYGFEIDGEIKADVSAHHAKTEEAETVKRMKQRREIRENLLSLRVKPSINDREREKTLQKIGTKGIVQLFNAVRAQQKDLDLKLQEAGKPEYKREKVLKNVKKKTFLDALMNGPRAKSEFVDNPVKEENRKRVKKEEPDSDDSDTHKSIWSALKEDFMTNNKNWEKSDDEAASNTD